MASSVKAEVPTPAEIPETILHWVVNAENPPVDNDLANMSRGSQPPMPFYECGDEKLVYFIEKAIRSQSTDVRVAMRKFLTRNDLMDRAIITPCPITLSLPIFI